MGTFSMKYKVFKQLRKNRAELSIIGGLMILPQNTFYLFQALLLTLPNVNKMNGIALWTNLMMFAAGVFAIAVMLPLLVTSFNFVHRKMQASKWKNLQEFAYIFYAMVYVQVMMVYLGRPVSTTVILNMVFYSAIFISYTILRVKNALNARKRKLAQAA